MKRPFAQLLQRRPEPVLKRWVFSPFLKRLNEEHCLNSGGNAFQTHGAAWRKPRPARRDRTTGMFRKPVEEPRSDLVCSCRDMRSYRYVGDFDKRVLKVRTAILKMIRAEIGSQCSFGKRMEELKRGGLLKISLAVLFWIVCSFMIDAREAPYNKELQ